MPMPIVVSRLSTLNEGERAACTEYRSDATLLHACTQGWSGEFNDSPRMQSMIKRAAQLSGLLDSAIQKFALIGDGSVYSGHGRGFSVVGSLLGVPRTFIGLSYRYPGYISTSADRGTAENFLRTRAGKVGTPVLLQLTLKKGQRLLPMNIATEQDDEAEYLLERNLAFKVIDAEFAKIDGVDRCALHLVLQR
jgi:hypothetical protein